MLYLVEDDDGLMYDVMVCVYCCGTKLIDYGLRVLILIGLREAYV